MGRVKPGHRLPALTFPSAIRARYPAVSGFLDEFLGTCLVGDYSGYRRLVSRAFKPESRERFEAIYRAVRAVAIESIEPIQIPRIPPPVYRVVSSVDFDPDAGIELRQTRRKIAILVFQEAGDWRMAPAPTRLQPRRQPGPTAASAPATSAPAFPWDQDGDY